MSKQTITVEFEGSPKELSALLQTLFNREDLKITATIKAVALGGTPPGYEKLLKLRPILVHSDGLQARYENAVLLLTQNTKIGAIKAIRELAGMDLKDAKLFIDELEAELGAGKKETIQE